MKKLNFIYQKKIGYLFLSPAIIFILGLFSEIIFASGFMKFVSDLDLIFITSFLTTTSFGSYILGYLDWQKKEDYFYSVYFENENKVDVKVDIILSKGVEGMRYVDNK